MHSRLNYALWLLLITLLGLAAVAAEPDYLQVGRDEVKFPVSRWKPVLTMTFDDPAALAACPVLDGAWEVKNGQLRAMAGEANRAILIGHPRGDAVRVEFDATNTAGADGRIGDISVLLNADRPFNDDERRLVSHAFSQIDSAMQHLRTVRELRRRQRELETIFRIDRIRDHTPEFQSLLDAVLVEVIGAMEAETGYLMLYNRMGNELEMRATTNLDLFAVEAAAGVIRSVSEEAIHSAELVNRTYDSGAIRAVVGVPLLLGDKLIGVLGVVNRTNRTQRFTRSDLDMLRAIASQMDTAIFESLQTQRLRSAFGQSVGPQVMDRLLSISDRDLLTGERRLVTTLFSDIRGFTNMSEQIPPELLQTVLNDHLSALTDVVLSYEGTLDKYIGDCVMCFFNAPENQADHAERAVRLALAMQKAHREVMARWAGELPLPPIGIGISTGETMMGNFGSVRRLEYTAIGRDVNLASRLCAAAEGDQTLISQATYNLVAPLIVADELPPLKLKGIEGEVRCWNVRGLR